MKKLMKNMMLAMVAMFALAFVAGCDGGGSSDDDTSTNTDGDDDSATGSDSDGDTDTASGDSDSDGDTDSDTDTGTDTNTEVDPTVCDCFRTGSGPLPADPENDQYCFNIEGDWYVFNQPQGPDTLLTVVLKPTAGGCEISFTGCGMTYSFTALKLPLKMTDEFGNHLVEFMEDTSTFFQKKYIQSGPDFDGGRYVRP